MNAEAAMAGAGAGAEVFCELPRAFAPCEFRIKWADGLWELGESRRLRREVFCTEQGVFEGDDLDRIDAHAQPLVALSCVGGMAEAVVGTVRIHVGDDPDDADNGIWWGSRLAVDRRHRHVGRIGATLIRLAVASAHARGARVFLAHVQAANRELFEKLHWRVLKDETLHGRPHLLMQVDLSRYPPCHDPLTGYVSRATPRPR